MFEQVNATPTAQSDSECHNDGPRVGQDEPVRVLVAPDSFGGTMTARQAAEAVATGWRRQAPDDELVLRPLSDGGPGFLDVLNTAIGGEYVKVAIPDPLGRDTTGSVLRVGDDGYVESADATGLHLLTKAERDPKITTSYGVGLLIAAAVDTGAHRVVVGLGGSATNDGGAGMMAALGAVALDGAGAALPYGGAALVSCDRLAGVPALRGAELVIASDVDSPLTGLHGASSVFGPQKGATREDVLLLDAALARWAEVLVRDLPGCPPDLATAPGAGAAGGLGAALLALGARRESGIALVRDLIGLDAALDATDLVVTGEGSFDFQSLRGKVAAGVAAGAAERALPCLVMAGQVSVGRREAAAAGIEAAYSVADELGSAQAAIDAGASGLTRLAERVAREWSRR
ncbi:glycerate kinase [Fodinicola feengrottensis]|uniref:Glycerate kinase n=1 Tax=Fodinicola feengrottensis TaxID=435914 RepID=A0ABN2IFH7_9ACTN